MRTKPAFFIFLTVSCLSAATAFGRFGAYYCKLDSGQSWEADFRAGPYADVMVRLEQDDQKLIFWRASSYLPLWQTGQGQWYLEEVVPRSGDGPAERPDKLCRFSRVRIIESNPARAIVHWRYISNFANTGWDGFVDEYFTVYPDGTCIRTIRRGAPKLDDWLGGDNLTIRKMRLAAGGAGNLPPQCEAVPDLLLTGESASAYENLGFNEAHRCWQLKCKQSQAPATLSFTLDAAAGGSVCNPAIEIENWGSAGVSVKVDAARSAGYKTGYVQHVEYKGLVLFLDIETTEPVEVTVFPRGAAAAVNRKPRVNAGEDRALLVGTVSTGPHAAGLAGSVDDDGLPNNNTAVSWSLVEGPGTADFADSNSPATSVSLSAEGEYRLRLTANDGSGVVSDDVIVSVNRETAPAVAPAAWWKFNEGSGETTAESLTQTADPVAGNKALWTAGVSGGAMIFDGYMSMVTHPASMAPAIGQAFTLEAWIAVKAYPWNWCPIVHRSGWESSGYYLGIDARGHLGLMASVAGSWRTLTSSAVVERNRWVHVAGTFDGNTGSMKIYIDGSAAGSRSVPQGNVSVSGEDIKIGKGVALPPTDYIRISTPASYAFDGIIDEVKIYTQSLSEYQIGAAYTAARPGTLVRDNPAIGQRVLPRGGGPDRFGAYYDNLRFHEGWDNLWRVSEHCDVVVRFDEPYRLVFWRGTSYVPHWSTENNKWYNNEFLETNGGGLDGCGEPMSDKMCRHSHVRIIENTPARVVVHWRYGLVDAHDNFGHVDSQGWGDWGDEYHYIYPDGAVVRQQHLFSSALDRWHEYHEAIIVHGPEQHPEDNIELDALHMARMDGAKHVYSWHEGPPMDPLPWPEGATIQLTNLKSTYDPFSIVSPTIYEVDCATSELTSASLFPWWNHWPVAQIPSDGRYAYQPDHTSHSALTNLKWAAYSRSGDLEIKLLLHGVTNKPAEQLAALNRSWEYPPQLTINSEGFSGGAYDKTQRAYRIVRALPDATELRCRLNGSPSSPIVNCCLVVGDWRVGDAALEINGRPVQPGADFRIGSVANADGTADLIVWVQTESTSAVDIAISDSSFAATDFNKDGVSNFLDFATLVRN